MRRVALLGLCLGALCLPATAHAAFPGANGKIAFTKNSGGAVPYSIWVMNADGSHEASLASGHTPTWSPDGTKIAYVSGGDIHVMHGDGSGDVVVASGSPTSTATDPSWSPDGSKLVFVRVFDCSTDPSTCRSELHSVNADGTGETPIVLSGSNPPAPAQPVWSPDGTRIAFTGYPGGYLFSDTTAIYTVNPDGTGVADITGTDNWTYPDWSPDGHRLSAVDGYLYSMNRDGTGQTRVDGIPVPYDDAWSPDETKFVFSSIATVSTSKEVFASGIDGTNVTQLTHSSPADSSEPDWQPIPQTYARPKGATPFKTYLVPAFKPCTAPNRTHGSPLAFPSCSAPTQTSSYLTVGTADSNGQPTKSVGSVRYDAFSCPACVGPGPNADVRIAVSITDVRNQVDLGDYKGELQLVQALRITDRNNTPNPGGPGPGTVSDTNFPTTVPCAATSDATVGSTCSVMTSANSLVPNAVVSGERAIWQLGQVQVYDGGSDGVASTTGNNTLFMDEGVFVP